MGVPGQTRLYSFYRGIKYQAQKCNRVNQYRLVCYTSLGMDGEQLDFFFVAEGQTVRCFRQSRVSRQPRHIHSPSYAVPKSHLSHSHSLSHRRVFAPAQPPCRSRVELPNHLWTPVSRRTGDRAADAPTHACDGTQYHPRNRAYLLAPALGRRAGCLESAQQGPVRSAGGKMQASKPAHISETPDSLAPGPRAVSLETPGPESDESCPVVNLCALFFSVQV
jgi:hypothetical protein